MNVYPVFLRLAGRRVVLVGGGRVAASKLPALLEAGARATVVAPEIRPEIENAGVQFFRKPFAPADLDGAFFVVAAATPEVNRAVAAAAEVRGLFVNAVDDARTASAFLGSVLRRGGVTVAISTGGRAPALARLLREALEQLFPDELRLWLKLAEELRTSWKADRVPLADRRALLLRALDTSPAAEGG